MQAIQRCVEACFCLCETTGEGCRHLGNMDLPEVDVHPEDLSMRS